MKKNLLFEGIFSHEFKRLKLIMRLTFLLSAVLIFNLSASVFSQNEIVTLKLSNASLKQIILNIEEQTGLHFFYQDEQISEVKSITLNETNQKLDVVLEKALNGSNLKYRIIENHVVIYSSVKENDYQQQDQYKTVTGKVTDSFGDPLPGVSVSIKGTTYGSITDLEGNYSLSNVTNESILVFSFIGMKKVEVIVGNLTIIDVILESDFVGLDEVVVVGYGTQKKENLTGAVYQIKMDDILGSRPVSSISQAIMGVIPGLQITSSTGQPGVSESIRIRGIESITGGNPLVLVDNVPMDMRYVNPADVESISVLKDAASSSIYGGRAAFGVILIKTKTGKRKQPIKFNYSNNFSTTYPSNLPQKAPTLKWLTLVETAGDADHWTGQNISTWRNLLHEYKTNPALYPEGETTVGGVLYRLIDTDGYELCMRNSFEQMHNFSFSGGYDRADYRVSFGYGDEDGILRSNKDTYTRYNMNLHLSVNVTDKLTSTTNVLYTNSNTSTPSNINLIFNNISGRGSHLNWGYHTNEAGIKIPFDMPNNILDREPPDKYYRENLRIFEKLEYKLLEGLNITGEYTFMNINLTGIQIATDNIYYDAYNYAAVPITDRGISESSYFRSSAQDQNHAMNLYIGYEKKHAGHEFKLLGGTNLELRKYSRFWTRRADLLHSQIPSLSTASGVITANESFDDFSVFGLFGRLGYVYNNRYLIEANVRYDGSSKFPQGDRFGLFPSFSAGWILTEESFMSSLKNIFNFVKIRGSYGEIGNQDISNYAYIPGINTYNAAWIDPATSIRALAITTPSLVSSSFTWETVRTKNIGIDMRFLDRRLNLTYDYYNRETLKMLGPGAELPALLGGDAPEQNVANLESKGWEFSLGWDLRKQDYGYSLGVNVSDDRGFITKYDNEGGLLSQYYVGYEFGEIWGYVTDGYFTVDDFVPGTLNSALMNGTLNEGIAPFHTVVRTNPGDIRYVDLNNDGIINPGSSTLSDPGDRKIIGNSNRRYQFGITGSGYYKNFDFSILIQGVGKCDFWMEGFHFPWTSLYSGFYEHQMDYWSPENPEGYFPRMYPKAGGNTNISRLPQSKYLLNGAYLRVKNIEIGYNLPKVIINRIDIDMMRVYVSGENLLKFDHLPKGIEPDLSTISGGIGYPYITKFSAGVNIAF